MSHESASERAAVRERDRRAQEIEPLVKELHSKLDLMRESSELEPDEFDDALAEYVAKREEKTRKGKR